MPISARFSPPHSYLALFLHGNQRRTRVANGTTSEELAYLQPVHGPRDLYPQKFCKKGDEKAAAPKARVAWSLEGEVPDEKNQDKDNSEEPPPAFTSQAGGSRTCRLPPPRNQARLAGLATARSTLCKRDLRERNLNLNFPFCSRCTLSSLNTEPCAPSRKLQTKTTGSRIIQSWLAQRGSLLAISYSESRAVWHWCGRVKLKAETFLDAPFPSSSASGGLASHPPCAGTATGPARHSPPPRLDRILSLVFTPPLRPRGVVQRGALL